MIWTFLLGFYLFLQVQFPLSFISVEFKHFFIFGCGEFHLDGRCNVLKYIFLLLVGPVLNMAIWIVLRMATYDPSITDVIKNCAFFETNNVDFYVCEVPILFILICNTFFLIWIMVVRNLPPKRELFQLFSDCYFQAA